ncbi:MraY family glycosyltransferase [Geosporobacter ferrireducens]|uniref:Undecaprenyl-phosphate alpha-N-acetylglucosaminyl 1-phosphate transferase n=2 Tax=Geosporobacter ferrireducens TaxID=1424294 RepID=A0A1D8GDS3_9FIRM|nr:MraY family glycosyltransferase [Geosporobacter ferrireducens]AOT69065.1 undecaprenyl-phosphate alpha-N-acetylglucosaminyl 1-phosphate transferase [Geosporobacter ferrireducens]MTI56737.1 undecaprenyl/decaprenyl-phosphate alpha-N-acetylglucosaminyl 1-phosphate transferase [Geosporobacter ferrireducens]
MKYFAAFVTAYLIVRLTIPYFRRLSIKIDFVDRPTERKIHKEPISLFGGVAMYTAFLFCYFLFIHAFNKTSIAILLGSFSILLIGMVDDWYKTRKKEFPVFPRLWIQLGAAALIYKSGIIFYGFTNPLTHEYILLPTWLQFILTITWIFGVTTVINFSDGMDGLAGGISAISASTLFIVALAKGQFDSAMLSILLVGVALGFLKYNKYPAQIFMGDSGANFLGFMLAVISLDGAFKQATFISISIPVLALGVPIFDNIMVVFKRFLEGKPVYKADRSQIHYRLLSSGLNQKQVVAFLYLISVCFSLTSIILLLLNV